MKLIEASIRKSDIEALGKLRGRVYGNFVFVGFSGSLDLASNLYVGWYKFDATPAIVTGDDPRQALDPAMLPGFDPSELGAQPEPEPPEAPVNADPTAAALDGAEASTLDDDDANDESEVTDGDQS